MVDIAVRQTEAPVLLSVCENLAAFFGKKYFRLSRKNGANYISKRCSIARKLTTARKLILFYPCAASSGLYPTSY